MSKDFNKVLKDAFKELRETLLAFIKAPRALWGINLPYVLEGLTYFGILTILGKFCSENVSLNDLHAGWVYGGVTGGITFAMLLFGGVSDRIGIRKSLALAFGGMVVGRLLVSLAGTLPLGSGMGSPMFLLMSLGLLIMVISYGTYQPAAYAGVKRYTTPKTAAMGYAVVYALMNLGAFLSGPIATFTRQASETTFPPNGLTAIFWVFTGITLLSLLATATIITKRVDQRAVERVARETREIAKDREPLKDKDTKPAQLKKNPSITDRSFFILPGHWPCWWFCCG
ncbi:MAG: MFS transporter [candidate division KSB1 bacterium]|nr:MFS transporter [candidate division KSB1 bacterium]